MAWIDQYLAGSKNVGSPEESYLYSSSAEMSPKSSYLGANKMDMASSGAESAAASGAGAAAMSSPASAGIMAGASFLQNYLAQRAADERARRDRDVQIQQQYAENQNRGFDTLMNTYRGALR